MLCCQKVLLAPLMGPDDTQHPGRLGTRAERNQGGANEYILEGGAGGALGGGELGEGGSVN